MNFRLYSVTLRGWIKEAACTLRKQDPTLPENHALNKCEECFKQVCGACASAECRELWLSVVWKDSISQFGGYTELFVFADLTDN